MLVIHQGALGDFVCAFPALAGLKKRWGRIDVLCRGQLGKLACELGVADNGFSFDAACFASLFSGMADRRTKAFLRQYRQILLFSFSKDLKQTIRRTTHGNVWRIAPRPVPGNRTNVSAHIIAELVALGLSDIHDGGFMPERRIKNFDPETILIHPGSGSRKKNWRIDRFAEVFAALKNAGRNPVFLLGPAEQFMEKEVAKNPLIAGTLRRVSDLSELTAVLGKSGGYIGNDSGVTHLAAYMGLRVVAIFGPSDPKRWCPSGKTVKIVRPDLACEPCFEIDKDRCADRQCLDLTTWEIVVDSFFGMT